MKVEPRVTNQSLFNEKIDNVDTSELEVRNPDTNMQIGGKITINLKPFGADQVIKQNHQVHDYEKQFGFVLEVRP